MLHSIRNLLLSLHLSFQRAVFALTLLMQNGEITDNHEFVNKLLKKVIVSRIFDGFCFLSRIRE